MTLERHHSIILDVASVKCKLLHLEDRCLELELKEMIFLSFSSFWFIPHACAYVFIVSILKKMCSLKL